MLALKIIDIREFMNQLLIGTTFDAFEMVEADITTFNTFSIDGKLKKDFFDTDTLEMFEQNGTVYSLWKELKPYCYSIIRGKRTPLYFKIVFQLPPRQIHALLRTQNKNAAYSTDVISGMFLNLQYKNNELLCTTGIALRTFVPDKTFQHQWDAAVLDFLRRNHIIFEQM